MIRIDIKPLSVNQCYTGRRWKTDDYIAYERSCLFLIPKIQLPPPPFKIYYEFGVSNPGQDIDNGIKIMGDILQKKFGFNDKLIMQMHVKKIIVPKGKEFVGFLIESLE